MKRSSLVNLPDKCPAMNNTSLDLYCKIIVSWDFYFLYSNYDWVWRVSFMFASPFVYCLYWWRLLRRKNSSPDPNRGFGMLQRTGLPIRMLAPLSFKRRRGGGKTAKNANASEWCDHISPNGTHAEKQLLMLKTLLGPCGMNSGCKVTPPAIVYPYAVRF